MTKEELKQEAEEYTKNLLKKLGIKEDMLLENQPKYLRQESMNFVALDVENVTDAYLASAEPREKRIAELEEQCLILADCNTCTSDCKTENIETKKKLTKARQFIRDFLSIAVDYIDKEDKNYSLVKEAEQFLNSEGK